MCRFRSRSYELVVPPWAASLPRCVFAVVRFFYLDLLLPEDDFEISGRKMLIALTPVMALCNPFLNGVLTLAVEEGSRDSFSAQIGAASAFTGSLLYIALFMFAKFVPERAGAGRVVDAWTLGSALLIMSLAAGRPQLSWFIPLITVMYIAVMLRAPHRGPIVALAVLGSFVSIYNRSAFELSRTPSAPLLAIPGSADRPVPGVRMDFAQFVVHVLLLVCLEVMMRAFSRSLAASRASVELAKQLAAALAQYDTAAASKALDEATVADKTDDAVVPDAALVEGWRGIVANLEQYRPYLPNWLVDSQRSSVSADSFSVFADDDGRTPSSRGRRHVDSSVGDDDDRVSVSSRTGRRHHTVSTPTAPPVAPCSSTHQYLELERAALQTFSRSCLAPAQALESRGNVAVGEFDVAASPPRSALPAAERASILHAFVDGVHAVARETRAAVHTFVGDTIVASWNAASPCAHPEAKAARFTARILANFCCCRNGVGVTGALVTGRGSVLVAGLGEQRALLLSLVPEATEVLRIARDEGRRRDAVLATSAFAEAAKGGAHFDLGAVLASDSLGATASSSPVILLHRVRSDGGPGADIDWLYAVSAVEIHVAETDEGSADHAVRVVLDNVATLCTAGRFEDGLSLLNDTEAGISETATPPSSDTAAQAAALGECADPRRDDARLLRDLRADIAALVRRQRAATDQHAVASRSADSVPMTPLTHNAPPSIMADEEEDREKKKR